MTELLERGDLLEQLGSLLAQRGRLVFVGGEAGVGKTSLVRTFAARTGEARVGSCENLAAPTPLGPFLDVGLEPGDPRSVAARALERGGTLVLEDVHWADGASLDVLRVLGRRIEGSGLVVVATYRDDEVNGDHPLRIVLGELVSARGVVRLSVPRLSLDAVRVLAEPLEADAVAIHRLTLGNAFYVTEILASGGAELPATVRDAVLARAALLDEESRRLLDAIAVVPRRAELSLLERVAASQLAHLDDCLASGVLRAEGDAVAFRHELARLAVADEIPPHRHRALHAAILAALENGGDLSRLAHHAEEAGDEDSVLRYAPAAARMAAAASSHREAAAQYRRALRHAGTLSPREHAELLDEYAEEAMLTGLYEESAEARNAALALYRELGDRLKVGETLSRVTNASTRLGRNQEAEEANREAIEILESLPPGRELAWAYAVQAYVRMLSRDNEEGVAWGRKAVATARAAGALAVEAYGLNMTGTSLLMAGRIEEGVQELERSLVLAGDEGNEVLQLSSLNMLGTGLGEMMELEAAERWLRECIDFADAHELWPVYPRSWLALVQVYRGRWDEGASVATSVLHGLHDPISRISALIALGRVRARRGDPGAFAALDEALELAEPGGHLQRLGHVRAARAEAAWLAGDPARAAEEARAVYELAVAKRHLWFAGELAYWLRLAGAEIEPPEWVAEPYRLQFAGAAQAAAAAWLRRGCPYEAARALADAGDAEALAELDRLGARPAATLLRRRLGLRGPRESTRENPAGLTAREVQVLELLATGKRNAEIAAELVLSPRTVDHHVSSILRKLEVGSRGEAAAAAAGLGLRAPR